MELKYYSPDWLSLEEYEQFVAQYHGAATSHHLLRTNGIWIILTSISC